MRTPFLILGLLPALILAAVACGEDAPIPTSVPTADRAQTAAPETTEVPAPIPTSVPTPDRAQTVTPETTEIPAPIPTSAPTPDRVQTATPETTEVPAPIPTSAPTPERAQTATPEATEVPAPIDGVELNIAESDPPQYFLEVTSGLPDACHTFERIETQRAGTEITVTVINRVLTGDIACAQVYETESSTMFLGSEFEADVTYTVRVNDWETSFTTEAAAVEVEAPIEDVTLNIVESDPPQYFLEIVSGLPTTCHILERNDVNQLPWEEVMVTVVNRVAATGPACAESGETKTTVVPLRSGFRPSETMAVGSMTASCSSLRNPLLRDSPLQKLRLLRFPPPLRASTSTRGWDLACRSIPSRSSPASPLSATCSTRPRRNGRRQK